MQAKEFKVIYTGSFARYLLKKGFQIIDVKPKKDNPKETVFIFRNSDALISEMIEYTNLKR